MSEEELGENIRDSCRKLGWRFLWLRRLQASSAGILDCLIIPVTHLERRHVLFRELKGYRKDGRLGTTTREQVDTILALRAAGCDAAVWTPDEWHNGAILEALR